MLVCCTPVCALVSGAAVLRVTSVVVPFPLQAFSSRVFKTAVVGVPVVAELRAQLLLLCFVEVSWWFLVT